MKMLSRKARFGLLAVAVAGGLLAARALWHAPTGAAVEGGEVACSSPEACHSHLRADQAPAAQPVQGKPRMLVFSSPSCAVCQRMASRVTAAVKACAAEGEVMHLNVDDDPGEGLASLYAVSLLPSYVNVDADGREVSRIVGLQPQERLEEALEEVRGTRCAAADEPIPSAGKGS